MKRKLKNAVRRVRRKLANLGVVRSIWSDRFLILYAMEAGRVTPIDTKDDFARNSVEHLALFKQTERWLEPGTFAVQAHARIAEGMHLYTSVRDGVLVHFAWLVPHQKEAWFPYVGQRYTFPEGTAVLFNAYTHPDARGGGYHERSMRRRLSDAAAQPGTRHIYTAMESHNHVSRAVAERVGFRCVDVLFERSRFGRQTRGTMTPATYFSTVEKRS